MSKTPYTGLSSVLPTLYLDLLEALGTSRALALAIAFRYNKLSENLDLLETVPSSYRDAHSLWSDSQAIAIFKKNLYLQGEGFKDSQTLHNESIERFHDLERVNAETNHRLALEKTFFDVSLIEQTKRIIRSVLGDQPPLDRYRPMFGPGSTFLLPSARSTIADKLDNHIDATPHALIYLSEAKLASPRLFNYFVNNIKTVPGNRYSSVAKDFRKRRPISVEPVFNMLLQKNIGDFIRNRLKRVGIVIQEQQEFHKFLLREFHDVYSTIDQSDASDRISIELIRNLLPPDWFIYLDRIRSCRTLIGDTYFELEKFASQGNGFIFELETLVFYAIAQAAIILSTDSEKHFVSAYGDDVIVSEAHFDAVCHAYERMGFKVNTEKSFRDGPFKESCGYDVFNGIPVRPFYLKEFSRGLAGIYEAYNYVKRISSFNLSGCGYDSVYKRACKRLLSLIRTDRQFFGPEILGDAVLHDSADKWKVRRENCQTYVRGIGRRYSRKHYRLPVNEGPLLAYAVFGYDSNGMVCRSVPYSLVTRDYVVVNPLVNLQWV